MKRDYGDPSYKKFRVNVLKRDNIYTARNIANIFVILMIFR